MPPRTADWPTANRSLVAPAAALNVENDGTSAVRQRRSPRLLQVVGRLTIQLAMTAATIVFLALAALPLIDHKALIVTSGSMEPLLSAGDAAVIHMVPPEELETGDVITYQGYSSDALTTHRILQPVQLDSGLHFQTQGDANSTPDPNLAPAGGVVGRYVTGIPHLGRVMLFLGQPHGRLLIVGLPALMILSAELKYLLSRRGSLKLASRQAAALGGVALLCASLATAGVWTTTNALMTEATPLGSNTFTSADTFPA